jgi:hypothetical protein
VTGSVKDTLVGARQELESRWRRLTFYLPPEEVDSDDTLTEQVRFVAKISRVVVEHELRPRSPVAS